MDEMEIIKQRRITEHHYGDVRKACEQAGVYPPIFQSAIRKGKIDDLTDKEMSVILAYIEILDKRKSGKMNFKELING